MLCRRNRGGDFSRCAVQDEHLGCSSQAGPIDTCWCEENSTHYSFLYHFTAIRSAHEGFWYCRKYCRSSDGGLFGLHMDYHRECRHVRINDRYFSRYSLSGALILADPETDLISTTTKDESATTTGMMEYIFNVTVTS
ncbi:hypothetical protein V1264_017929 [Littorina saxatilis]|uniref:Uncharacterized protein n=1 Tax=Littorina saxatilis TaxID=31220 RepID=A0AAN9BNK9_9CAEN